MKAQAHSFALPKLTGWQRRVLQTAVSMIGDPYIWGGTSESGWTAPASSGASTS